MHLASSSARRIFDVVITSAQKPAFYNRDSPFRLVEEGSGSVPWRRSWTGMSLPAS